MLHYDTVIFDLDGTVFDTEEGLLSSHRYILQKQGYAVPSDDTLRRFIGPSLQDSLTWYCAMNHEQIVRYVAEYRPYYIEHGWKKTRLYPGIRALMHQLKKQGAHIYVATGKPIQTVEKLLKRFYLAGYVEDVAAPDALDVSMDKEAFIHRLLDGKGSRKAVMIGDIASDITGARAAGVDAVGVSYGYGGPDAFKDVQPCRVASDAWELASLLMDEPLPQKGYFITIEGLDGCGKTTQSDAVAWELAAQGYTVRRTREPGGCPISEKIRDLLLDRENAAMTDITEALLYAASRAQHVRQVIRPAMERGEIVLCDRFVDSSVAFQGGGRQLGVGLIERINEPAVGDCAPDATVYLRLDHETALRRRENASALDRIESEKASFHARVEAAYDQLAANHANRFIAVDARNTPEQITAEIMDALLERMFAAEVL